MATKTLLTVEEFLRLPESVGGRDVRYELVEGEVIIVSPTMPEHNNVRDTLLVALRNFLAGRDLGRVWSEQAFHLFAGTVRIPDIAFVRAGRSIESRRLPEGGPDLAIEVVSPSNTPRELDQRVWLIYPEHGEVYIHGLAGVRRRRGDETLEDAELLPGFSVKVSSLFEQG